MINSRTKFFSNKITIPNNIHEITVEVPISCFHNEFPTIYGPNLKKITFLFTNENYFGENKTFYIDYLKLPITLTKIKFVCYQETSWVIDKICHKNINEKPPKLAIKNKIIFNNPKSIII